jgi:thymidylate synthase ThyX
MEVTYPRLVHSEMMTHRLFSRNAASSRAIPIKKMIEKIKSDPVIPVWWGKAQPGMSADEEIEAKEEAQKIWLEARDQTIQSAEKLLALGLHKQIPNRILENFGWITLIISGTQPSEGPGAWSNFFALRRHKDAQPEIHRAADLMFDAYSASKPVAREWHTPYIQPDEYESLDLEVRKMVSTARVARVSYLTHDGKREIAKDLELFEQLKTGSGSGHWSPFEHIARALEMPLQSGNFIGWEQYRKQFKNECR